MPQVKVEVKQYGVRYVCDDCGKAEMVHAPDDQGMTLISDGLNHTWRHKCPACGATKALPYLYPTILSEIKKIDVE